MLRKIFVSRADPRIKESLKLYYKGIFWSQFFSREEQKQMITQRKKTNDPFADALSPSVIEMTTWMIKNRKVSQREKLILNPMARCWHSNKKLFGKRAIRIVCWLDQTHKVTFYFGKKDYLFWLMKT